MASSPPAHELALLRIADGGISTLSVGELTSDIQTISSFLGMFTCSEGTMRTVCGVATGNDLTFETLFAKVREYDPADFPMQIGDGGTLQSKQARKAELEKTIETMRGIGLAGTSDFRRFEGELREMSRTVETFQAQHAQFVETMAARLNAIVPKILQMREAASPQLLECMRDGSTTLSQALRRWMDEARGRL